MLVKIDSTKLTNNVDIHNIVNYVEEIGSRFRCGFASRDVDEVIALSQIALLKYNPKLTRRDIIPIYQDLSGYRSFGALVYDGNLKACHDKGRSDSVQLHVDDTMVILTVGPRTHPSSFDNVLIHIPDNQAFKPVYYCPAIFNDYLLSKSNQIGQLGITKEDCINFLLRNLNNTCGVLKSREYLTNTELELFHNYLLRYAFLIANSEKGETPEKYVISNKWITQVTAKIKNNPYFMFRHIWRMYFRLAKEGQIF